MRNKEQIRIGILTQPLSHNYGGIIQNYALQQTLKKSGFYVETINHHFTCKKNFKKSFLKFAKFVLQILFRQKIIYSYTPTIKETSTIEKNLLEFINKYITTSSIVTSKSDLNVIDINKKYNAYVVGSDQCWRPRYNKGYLNSMFLDFVKSDAIKIAYAVSFGTDSWEYTPQETRMCSELVKKFMMVTVRENSGVYLCKQYFGVSAKQVLDPTLLLNREDYISLIKLEREQPASGSLFNYILDPNNAKMQFVSRVENETGFSSFQILPKYHSAERTKEAVKKHLEDCIYPSMTAWLRAFWDARMVIVDSFHGMVFSIIFNKPFWVLGNKKRGMSRFTSLLSMLNLEDRLVNDSLLRDVDVLKPIDWDRVNKIIENEKNESINLLINALQNA